MAKRDIIIETIEAGGATKDSLMEAAEVDAKGLASQFTYMRLMGKCPVVDDDGVFSLITGEEWEALKADRAANSTAVSKLTPAERFEKATKSSEKADKALVVAQGRLEKDEDNRKVQIRCEVADLTAELRNIELDEAQALVDSED